MRYQALAADYDGTLARDGRIDDATLSALRRWKDDGRALVMVTGREFEELREVCPSLGIFDRVVAENGGLLHRPENGELVPLAEPPPPAFVDRLRDIGVGPISVGRVVVATWMPHDRAVADAIREMGLPLRVIRNKRAVMVLPEGVDKGSGLASALSELGIDRSAVAAVGDAENDLSLLQAVGLGVAVANAVASLSAAAAWTTTRPRGAGVAELIDRLLRDDQLSSVST